jgi:ribosomal protein S18 acetylase RimI-like enzyme
VSHEPLISELTLAQAPLVFALHRQCFDVEWDEASVVSLMSMPGFVGHLSVMLGPGEPEPTGFILMQRSAEQADILSIGVLPKYLRRGIGRSLLAQALDGIVTLGVQEVFLEVAKDNASAVSFYESLAFQKVGERANYYKVRDKRVDALILKLDLDQKRS